MNELFVLLLNFKTPCVGCQVRHKTRIEYSDLPLSELRRPSVFLIVSTSVCRNSSLG